MHESKNDSYDPMLFQKVVECVEALTPEEQDLLISLIKKRRIESRRAEIAVNAIDTLEAL